MKFALKRRIGVTVSSILVASAFVVLPATSMASARTAHVSASTCVAKGTATPTPSGSISMKFQGTSSASCSATLHGQWTANSSQFDTAYANVATAGPAGDWSSAIASPELHGTISGVLPASSTSGGTGTGGTGTGTLGSASMAWSISCSFSYPPLRISCTIHIATN